ncbi:MAG: FtsW/RodA/SpoVE family cell cycle protein, partial [Pseudomonadota bacterium]
MPAPIFQRLHQPHLLQSNRYSLHLSVLSRLGALHWGLIFFVCAVACIGFALLYSAAGGKMEPWAKQQIIRYSIALAIMFGVALISLRFWMRYAYVAYFLGILLLVAVEVIGLSGGGAQRWIAFGPLRVQPSEVMKIALVLALARYFHKLDFDDIGRPTALIVPLAIVGLPVALVLKQPDLGTAVILGAVGGVIFFLAGVR